MSTMTKQPQLRCKGCASGPPRERTDSRWWLPGIIILELRQPDSPKRIFGPQEAALPKNEASVDVPRLREIVDPLLIKQPEWTFAFERDKPPTERDYERYITLHLQPEVNVPAIAKVLRSIGGVVRAAGEPRLAPPRRHIPLYPVEARTINAGTFADAQEVPLFNEPLALSGGEPLGKSFQISSQHLRNQWYLFRSQVDRVVQGGLTGAGVVAADIDWGFRVTHQEFANGKIKFTYNASNGSADVSSGSMKWHGTASLGLLGAGDNDAGMLGFAPGADLWAIQGQDDAGSIDNSTWGNAIETVRLKDSNGKRKVILIEAATDSSYNVEASTLISVPITKAITDSNCVVCVTAGNLGVDAGKNEAGEDIDETGSILVGATIYKKDPAVIWRGDSNFGPRVVVSAPGSTVTDVTCCDCGNNGYTDSFGGTSGAAAKVAGAMALLLERFPEIKHQEIVEVLKTKMDRITTADQPIGCFLDVKKLIDKTQEFWTQHH